MRHLQSILVQGSGPEDVLWEDADHVICSLRDEGRLVRVALLSGRVDVCAETGGMPLGLDWMPDGRVLVCNAELGPQVVDLESGLVSALPCDIEFGVCNNAHVLADGTVLISDSSAVYPLEDYSKDIIENTASGRLVKLSSEGRSSVLLDKLSFANGVACIDDDQTVLVAQTGAKRINRVGIDGSDAGIFAHTPGHPDNISIGSDGNVWVAIPSLPSAVLAKLHAAPLLLRRIAARLPEALQPKPELCCRVVVYDSKGGLIKTYDGDTDVFSFATGVRERAGKVALGSIEHDCIGVFDSREAQPIPTAS